MRSGVADVFPLDLPKVDASVAQRTRQAGFAGVSAALQDPEACTEEEFTRVSDTLGDAGVTVAYREANRAAGIAHHLAVDIPDNWWYEPRMAG